MNKSHIEFSEHRNPKKKTLEWTVHAKSDATFLGHIQWYSPWRQYVFYPEKKTLWSRGCLAEIIFFIAKNKDTRNKGV